MAHPLALPKTFSPDALDTTPELAAIVMRLQLPQSTGSAAGGATLASASVPWTAGGGPASGVGTGIGVTVSGGGGVIGSDGSGGATSERPIPLRDLLAATDGLKHKLQHAGVQIKQLPDMGRSVAAQAIEIEQLEARIAAQRAVLAQLRAEGQRFAAEGQPDQQRDIDKMEL